MLIFGIGLATMTGFAVYHFQVFWSFILIEIEMGFVDVYSHPHHFSCIFFHGIIINNVIEAIRKTCNFCMTEFTGNAKRLRIRFHDAV